jgi:hypothetical protein
MSIEDAKANLQALAPKAPGHLIRAEDWNTLIESLVEYGTLIAEQAAQIQPLLALPARLSALETRIDQLEQSIEPLLGSYIVKLSSARISYATGELCEILATVTDLQGAALPAPFPWIDLVAAWGRLRPAPGFNSRAGSGDNALSVQVNAQGIARVILRAEHSDGFSAVEEAQILAVLDTRLPSATTTIAQAFMMTTTPNDPQAKSAYQLLHREYDRRDSSVFRHYADTYHLRTPEWNLEPAAPSITASWRDFRATVIALAKPDADPTTADGSHGAASIQVTFRDWLWPWIFDYTADVGTLREDLIATYIPLFEAADTFELFRDKLILELDDRGVLGRKKYLQASKQALDVLTVGSTPGKVGIKRDLTAAIGAQLSTELYVNLMPGLGVALFDAQLGASQATLTVAEQLGEAEQAIEQNAGMFAMVNVLEGRVQSVERIGSEIQSSLTLINDNVRAINPLDGDSLKVTVNKISADLATLKSRFG